MVARGFQRRMGRLFVTDVRAADDTPMPNAVATDVSDSLP